MPGPGPRIVKVSKQELAALYPEKPKKKRTRYKKIRTRVTRSTECVSVHIGYRLRSPNQGGYHWGQIKQMRDAFEKAVQDEQAPLAVTKIHCIRWIGKHGQLFDKHDNLRYAFKWFCDSACKWIGVDDADERLEFTYEQLKNDEWGVTVRLS